MYPHTRKHTIHLHHVFADDNLLLVLYEDVNELVVFLVHGVEHDAWRLLSRLLNGRLLSLLRHLVGGKNDELSGQLLAVVRRLEQVRGPLLLCLGSLPVQGGQPGDMMGESPAEWRMGATAAQNQFESAGCTTQVQSWVK